MTQVAGRTAFITGAAHGIGRAVAGALAQEGVKLAPADLDDAGLKRARGELSAITAVETVVHDVRDRAAFERSADEVEARLGPGLLLVNHARIVGGSPARRLTGCPRPFEARGWTPISVVWSMIYRPFCPA